MAAKEHFEDCTDGRTRATRLPQCQKVLGLPSSSSLWVQGRDQNDLPAATLCHVSCVHVHSLLSFSNSALLDPEDSKTNSS